MNEQPTVLITGGTGLIGTTLSKSLLDKGYRVIILTRKQPTQTPGTKHAASQASDVKNKLEQRIEFFEWNVEQQKIDEEAIKKADHVIHLAGANVAGKRWTAKRKKEIRESRTQSSALIVKALREIPNNVKTVVSASAIGWYGNDIAKAAPFNEDDGPAEGFLGETCKAWEESIDPVKGLGKRLVKLRTGIVLSNEGGALKEFRKPLNFGMATILGSGKQMISWIHVDDLCRMYCYAIEHQELEGVYNAVGPKPVSNKMLVLELARQMKGKFFVPVYVPAFALKIALGEMSIEVLKSTTVNNQRMRQAGFRYIYPSIEAALGELNKSSKV